MMPIISFGTIHVPTFFLVISLSLSGLLIVLSDRVNLFKKDRKAAFDLALVIMISGFVGGRMLHVFFEEWNYYKEYPERIIEFWRGGFVFYGGLFTSLLSAYAFTYYRKLNFREWADFFAPLLSLAHAFGRIGCLLSGCCFGHECELPWAYEGRHPTVLYLFFGELIILFILLHYEQKRNELKKGHIFAKWILFHAVLRLNVEYFRNDFRGVFFNIPPFGHLSISQVISLTLIVSVLIFYYFDRDKKIKGFNPPPPPV